MTMNARAHHLRSRDFGFTLIELSLALAGAAVILLAIYGVFSKAVHLRDNMTERTRAIRVRTYVANLIRNDLRGARVSGGTLAATLIGNPKNPNGTGGNFPGYLTFITTTARDIDNGDDVATPDIQQVEYYITTDPSAQDSRAGLLVRTVDNGLLAPTRNTPPEQPLLPGVESMTVEFYDGNTWQTSWDVSQDPTLPQGIRVRIQPVADMGSFQKPAPIEIIIPWLTQSSIDPGVTEQSYVPAVGAGGTKTPATPTPTGGGTTGTGAGTGGAGGAGAPAGGGGAAK